MPLYGHFFHWDTELLGKKEQLDVEDPCGEVLAREYLLSCLSGEEFEAALSVADVADSDDSENGVKSVHEEVAEEGALQWCEYLER